MYVEIGVVPLEATFLKSFKIYVATGDSNVGTGPILQKRI
jgi:hypothetical protein